MKYCFLLLLFTLCININAQEHPDFEVTDTDGKVHKLYEDYLDKGTTVVIKIFFVACPPCNSIAPSVQALYEEWGEGTADVQFFEMTTLSGDDNADVKGYKEKHNITFPGISQEGGAKTVVDLYKNRTFGTYYGTPSFAVIAPDRNTVYGNTSIPTLRERIAATGAKGKVDVPETTIFKLNLNWYKNFSPNMDSLKINLTESDGSGSTYELNALTNGTLQFTYPSEVIPLLNNPVINIAYYDSENNIMGVNATDITLLRKHILGFKPFTSELQNAAADTNGDGRLTATDITIIRKVILGFIPNFRNNVPAYFTNDTDVKLITDPGKTIELNFQMLKTADFN